MKETSCFLHTRDLAVGYGGKALLQHITLGVRRGEILTLIGPNGAGKSTLLKSLSRQLALVGGTVYLDGRTLQELSPRQLARTLSVVTTQRVDPELMTCADVVATGRIPYTGRLGLLQPQDRAIVAQSLAQVKAQALAEQPFAQCSDGQRQRILLARALCQQPQIMLLDEPTSFLDVRHKLELLSILKQLVLEQGLAVVLSLHELDLAQRISDTVVCLDGQGVARIGPPEQVFAGDFIHRLYGITTGSYDPLFGNVELARPQGPPELLVIGGGGQGIPVYRRLQRQGRSFAAGILYENDLDLPVAGALAAQVVTAPAYEPVPPQALEQALELLGRCRQAVCCLQRFGSYNAANQSLWQAAGAQGKQADWRTL